MRFAYRQYESDELPSGDSDEILRPALKVRVIGREGMAIQLWGILDTGAEDCVLPFEVAELITPGLFEKVGYLVDYTGGEHAVRYGKVTLQIQTKNKAICWPAAVAFDPHRGGQALWGMAGFLEHFRITFDGPGQHFTIRLPGTQSPPGFVVYRLPRRRGRSPSESAPITPDEQDP